LAPQIVGAAQVGRHDQPERRHELLEPQRRVARVSSGLPGVRSDRDAARFKGFLGSAPSSLIRSVGIDGANQIAESSIS
jgi:hypothetical protein